MSLSFVFFGGAVFFMVLVIGACVYLSKRGVFKKTAEAAAQAVATDVQNAADKVAK